jgi:hypothetical protein
MQDHSWLPTIAPGLPWPWAVAGGWAIDLFVGQVTRTHADLEITILRRDQLKARTALNGWHLEAIDNGEPTPWHADTDLAPSIHEIHGRRGAEKLELLLSESEGEHWIYRRDRRIALSLSTAFLETKPIPYLAPEVVLLFKSKDTRPKDHLDFHRSREMLTAGQRRWLRTALDMVQPAHPWIKALA